MVLHLKFKNKTYRLRRKANRTKSRKYVITRPIRHFHYRKMNAERKRTKRMFWLIKPRSHGTRKKCLIYNYYAILLYLVPMKQMIRYSILEFAAMIRIFLVRGFISINFDNVENADCKRHWIRALLMFVNSCTAEYRLRLYVYVHCLLSCVDLCVIDGVSILKCYCSVQQITNVLASQIQNEALVYMNLKHWINTIVFIYKAIKRTIMHTKRQQYQENSERVKAYAIYELLNIINLILILLIYKR